MVTMLAMLVVGADIDMHVPLTFLTPGISLTFLGSLSGSMFHMDATPLCPGGQQPYNGAFGEAVAGPTLTFQALTFHDNLLTTSDTEFTPFPNTVWGALKEEPPS